MIAVIEKDPNQDPHWFNYLLEFDEVMVFTREQAQDRELVEELTKIALLLNRTLAIVIDKSPRTPIMQGHKYTSSTILAHFAYFYYIQEGKSLVCHKNRYGNRGSIISLV